jgi:hypothetical protein
MLGFLLLNYLICVILSCQNAFLNQIFQIKSWKKKIANPPVKYFCQDSCHCLSLRSKYSPQLQYLITIPIKLIFRYVTNMIRQPRKTQLHVQWRAYLVVCWTGNTSCPQYFEGGAQGHYHVTHSANLLQLPTPPPQSHPTSLVKYCNSLFCVVVLSDVAIRNMPFRRVNVF